MHGFPVDDCCPQVEATLKFINGEDFTTVKPYFYGGDLHPDQEHLRSNLSYKEISGIKVSDIRDRKHIFELDTHGVQFFTATGDISELPSTEEHLERYLGQLSEWIRHLLGAEKAIVYDFAFRRSLKEANEPEVSELGSMTVETTQPAEIPHIDQTRENGIRRAMRHMTDREREEYLDGSKRIRILNIWRPICDVVHDWPLTLCDPVTVSVDDLIRVDRLRPTYAGEIYYLQYAPSQRWCYLGDQTSQEITVFNGFDTHPGMGPSLGEIKGVPHASFRIMNEGINPRRRESMEVRVIIVG